MVGVVVVRMGLGMGVTVLLEMDNPRDGVVCAVCGERAADGGA